MHRTIFAALGLLVFGCTPAPAEYFAEFDCGGRTVSVAGNADEIRMTAGGKTYNLQRSISASGERYESKDDPTTTYWNKGNDAMVAVAGEDYPTCRSTEVSEAAGGNLG